MKPSFPSSSSALPARRNVRRRSGQGGPSPLLEADHVTSVTAYSPSWQVPHHVKHVINVPEVDPYRSRITGDTRFPAVPIPQFQDGASPTIVLVRPQCDDSESTLLPFAGLDNTLSDSVYLRMERPLPPLPEETTWELHHQADLSEHEGPLSPIPLTPRPEAPRFPSRDSQTSKISQRSMLSLFPRLPTPDFTRFDRDSLKQAIIAPLNFLRSRTTSAASVPFYRSSSLRSSKVAGASKNLHASTDVPVPLEEHPPHYSCTKSSESSTQSLKPSGTLCDDEFFSAFMAAAPSRFTRKFPSLASVSSLSRSPSKMGCPGELVASESGNGLGFESIGAWRGYKWCLIFSVLTVFGYAVVGFLYSILIWFGSHAHADVIWVADNDILIFVTLASSLLLLTGLVGLSGTLLNSRPILVFYALLLWPSFISVLVVGYTSYKREAFSLDRKLSMAWSQWYDDMGRLLIQESLHCCGFYNPLHEATFSKNCYPRTPLPGCKGKLYRFEKDSLRLCWRLAFSLVPLHILNITVSLLCSNHVDRRFGKGLTPRAYRLTMTDVRANADVVLAQFAGTKLPSEPSRSLSHVTDREDRPGTSRMQHRREQGYAATGQTVTR